MNGCQVDRGEERRLIASMLGTDDTRGRSWATIAGIGALAMSPPEDVNINEILFAQPTGVLTMKISRSGSQPSAKGPADWFSGTVRIDPLFTAPAPARVAGAAVTFEPGARTAWHTHPLGQTLIVTFGCGRAQRDGGPIEEIRPGDVVWFEPGEKHWHGASPTTAMQHVAIQEALDGKAVDWLEQVSEEQYQAKPSPNS